MTIRLFDDHEIVLTHQPFAGGTGSALYVGHDDPANKPGPQIIQFDRGELFDGHAFISLGELILGGTNVTKTRAVAIVKDPAVEFEYSLPDAMLDQTIWAQVRRHAGGVENPTIYQPIKITADAEGEGVDTIGGHGRITAITKFAGGGFEFQFRWMPSLNGLPPAQFRLEKTAGTGTIADVLLTYVARQTRYKIAVTGLTDAEAYTFNLSAENGTATKLLPYAGETDLDVTADASGPPAPTALSLVAH